MIIGTVAYSGHLPIWLDTEATGECSQRKKLFKFEAMWTGELDCQKLMEEVWMPGVNENIIETFKREWLNAAGSWNRVKFGNVQLKLQQPKNKLQKLIERDPTCQNKETYHVVDQEVQKWLEMKETKTQSSFTLKLYKEKGKIRLQSWKIKGNWEGNEEINQIIIQYFQELF